MKRESKNFDFLEEVVFFHIVTFLFACFIPSVLVMCWSQLPNKTFVLTPPLIKAIYESCVNIKTSSLIVHPFASADQVLLL